MFLQHYGMVIQDYFTGYVIYPSEEHRDGLEPNLLTDPHSLAAVSGLIHILKKADFRGRQALDPISTDNHHIQAQFFDGTAHLGLEPREAGVVTVSSQIHYTKPDDTRIGSRYHTPYGEQMFRSTSASYQRVERDDRLSVRYSGDPATKIDLDVALSLLRKRIELSYHEEQVRQQQSATARQIMGQLFEPTSPVPIQNTRVLPPKIGLVAKVRQMLGI